MDEPHYERGMELFSEDRLEEAIHELTLAVEADPQHADALHALSMCCYHAADYDRAIEYGERFRQLEPEDVLAFTSLSMFYQKKGMIEKAEEMGAKAKVAGFKEAIREAKEKEASRSGDVEKK
ncbi:MAG: hypothetical protein HY645_09215 [Acidobacteria bacterium]|nr:hypothetical protein [Acidobacteriota bacterium]